MEGTNGTPPNVVAQITITMDQGMNINVGAQVPSRAVFLMMIEEAKAHVLAEMAKAAAQKVVMPPPGLRIPRV